MASETVKFWIEQFENNDVSIDDEIDDVLGTISNERLWIKGASSKEEVEMHEGNIVELEEYLDWLKSQKE